MTDTAAAAPSGKRRRIAADTAHRHWKAVLRVQSPTDACPSFTAYYRRQLAPIMADREWPDFFASLARPLPVTIRLNTASAPSAALAHLLAAHTAGDAGQPPLMERVPALPRDVTVWRINADRRDLHTAEGLRPVHGLLQREAALGHLSRQEIVSMLPALLLDVQPHHWVLDMCAAPGSKTRQLVEALHRDASEGLPCGVVVGNDSDPRRMEVLRRKLRRVASPSLVLTCERGEDLQAKFGGRPDLFDRVLCDAPCSGDGTVRKAPEVWRTWSPAAGPALHPIQLQLALAALRLTKPGGVMVYATCSMNPIEDEAVVAALLRCSRGAAELVDVAPRLPGLRLRPGLSTWDAPHEAATSRSMSPPTNAEKLGWHLGRCARVLPHDQDTGGFFLACIVKRRPLPDDHAATANASAVSAEATARVLRSLHFDVALPTATDSQFLSPSPAPSWLCAEVGRVISAEVPPQWLWTARTPKGSGARREPSGRPVHLLSPGAARLLAGSSPALRVAHAGVRLGQLPAPSPPTPSSFAIDPEGAPCLLTILPHKQIPLPRRVAAGLCAAVLRDVADPPHPCAVAGHVTLASFRGRHHRRLKKLPPGDFRLVVVASRRTTSLTPRHALAPILITVVRCGAGVCLTTPLDRLASYRDLLRCMKLGKDIIPPSVPTLSPACMWSTPPVASEDSLPTMERPPNHKRRRI